MSGEISSVRTFLGKHLAAVNDTLVWNTGRNFGHKKEFYCLYFAKFFYRPWWYPNGIEFRPFRNVRLHKKYKNRTYQIIGHSKRFHHDPAFTRQQYEDGEECENNVNRTQTIVTYLCGDVDRISDFKVLRDCEIYELLFETPLKCETPTEAKKLNQLSIQKYGKENYTYLHILAFFMITFLVLCIFLKYMNKRRFY